MEIEYIEGYETQKRGTLEDEYQIYLSCADNGHGGDITNDGLPLATFDEWVAR